MTRVTPAGADRPAHAMMDESVVLPVTTKGSVLMRAAVTSMLYASAA